MSFMLNLSNDTHRIFAKAISDRAIKTYIIWKKGDEMCLDTQTHRDYTKAKDLQIQLDTLYKDVPCV